MNDDDPKVAALRVLHLEDSEVDHLLVQRELRRSTVPVDLQRVETLAGFEAALQSSRHDIVLADYRLSGFTALDAWTWMQTHGIRMPFVLLSGAIGESAAVAAIRAGISDYLPKDDLGKLRHVIERAIQAHALRLAKEQADQELAQSQRHLASFAEHLQRTVEQERAAIAREIHDDIGGSLAAIRFDLAWVGRHVTDPPTLDHIQAATDMLQHAIDASQRIMRSLRPAILDQGLAAAVHWLADSFSRRTGIACTIVAQLRHEPASKAVQLTIYRTAQEALTNISKHAQCTQAKVELTGDDHFITLEVSDNGQGMSAHPCEPGQGGFGLIGLRERAKAAGGWLDVSSRTGCGTSIILSIPNSTALQTTPEVPT